MCELKDEELLEELSKRMAFNRRALHDLHAMTLQLEQMNLKLRESEAVKGSFLSNIRNEIINPMASILGLSLQLAQMKAPPETVATMARLIHDEAFNLDFQLSNIFAAAALEAGEAYPSLATVDLAGLCEKTVTAFSALAERKNIKIILDVAGVQPLRTDPEKVQLILSNLLANAIEFGPQGSQVWVILRTDDEMTLTVVDGGSGIDPARQKEIFDRFRQMETGTAKSHRGHGLGLSIVQEYLNILGGRLQLTSAPGEGSRFSVAIPFGASVDPIPCSQEGNDFLFEEC